jgi:hypothetical protein
MTVVRLGLALFCAALTAGGAAPAEAPLLEGLTFGPFAGWTNCLALNDQAHRYQAVVVPAFGGRLLHYSHDLINILYQNPAADGLTLDTATGPFYAGGYQCDLGPETAALAPRLGLLLGRHEWRAPRDFTVETASPVDPGVGIRLFKSFTMDPDTGELGLLQRMLNASPTELAHSFHDRTACKGGGFVFFKLNPASRHTHGWSTFQAAEGRYFYTAGDRLPAGCEIADGHLLIATGNGAAKLGADVAEGWVAYALGRLLFVKYFPVTNGGDYPDGGNTVAVMWNGTVTELSPLSPRVALKPGAHFDFPSRWLLKPLKRTVRSFRDVRRILDEVPANPFRQP